MVGGIRLGWIEGTLGRFKLSGTRGTSFGFTAARTNEEGMRYFGLKAP